MSVEMSITFNFASLVLLMPTVIPPFVSVCLYVSKAAWLLPTRKFIFMSILVVSPVTFWVEGTRGEVKRASVHVRSLLAHFIDYLKLWMWHTENAERFHFRTSSIDFGTSPVAIIKKRDCTLKPAFIFKNDFAVKMELEDNVALNWIGNLWWRNAVMFKMISSIIMTIMC